MNEETKLYIRALMDARMNIAGDKLELNPDYISLCEEVNQNEQVVDSLYERFSKEELLIIRNHYEKEFQKFTIQMSQFYLQGLQDAFGLTMFLSGFNDLVNI